MDAQDLEQPVTMAVINWVMIRRFYDSLFPELPKEILDNWFKLLKQKPVHSFNESLTRALGHDTTSMAQFALISAGVSLALGSSDVIMSRGFDVADRIEKEKNKGKENLQ